MSDAIQRGMRVRAMRKALGWNQVALAEKLGVDQSTVSDIENGKGFSADILIKMAEALKTTPAMVMQGHDEAFWPFRRVPLESFAGLSPEDRSYVEGVLAKAIADLSPDPTAADMEVFKASHVRTMKSPPKRKAA